MISSSAVFLLGLERGLELGAAVEVVFHGRLVATGDDDDLGAAGGDRLLNAVLNKRLVDEAEHLLGDGFGGGEKARAQSGGGKDCFANLWILHCSHRRRAKVQGSSTRLNTDSHRLHGSKAKKRDKKSVKIGVIREYPC